MKAAIIGLGNIAWKYDVSLNNKEVILTHAGAYNHSNTCQLIGGVSPCAEDREEFEKYFSIKTYSCFPDLLKEQKPDIVSICSPSAFHFDHTAACIEAGIPMIWLEKPPTINQSQIETLLEKNSKSTILVSYQRRYNNLYNRLKTIIETNTLGIPVNITINYSRGLLTNGSHILDSLFFLLNEDELQFKHLLNRDEESPGFYLETSRGLPVVVNGLSLPYHCLDIICTFTGGRASVLYGGMKLTIEKKKEHELFPGFYRMDLEESFEDSDMNMCLASVLCDLTDSHLKGREPKSNLVTSRKTQVLIDTVLKKCKDHE